MLEAGEDSSITFANWYAGAGHAVQLQFFTEKKGYKASSNDPLVNRKVEAFDFDKLVDAFDTARGNLPTLSHWTLTSGLLAAHLSRSDSEALGGDLAYQYAQKGDFEKTWLSGAQATLADSRFGVATQSLQNPLSGAQTYDLKLG